MSDLSRAVANHTPGPWRAERVANESGDTLYLCHLMIEPAIAGLWAPPGDGRREADARLIAAAPDLLAALRRIWLTLPFDSEERQIAMAALTRATGGAT